MEGEGEDNQNDLGDLGQERNQVHRNWKPNYDHL